MARKQVYKITYPNGNYVPNRRYAQALFDNPHAMSEVTDDVLIDWSAADRTHRSTPS